MSERAIRNRVLTVVIVVSCGLARHLCLSPPRSTDGYRRTSERSKLSADGSHCVVLTKHFNSVTVPISTQEYRIVMTSIPSRESIAILPFASCYGNRDKLRQCGSVHQSSGFVPRYSIVFHKIETRQ